MSDDARVSSLDFTAEDWLEDGTVVGVYRNRPDGREMIRPDRDEWPGIAKELAGRGWTIPASVRAEVDELRGRPDPGKDEG